MDRRKAGVYNKIKWISFRERTEYMVHIGNDWDELLKGEFDKEYYQKLRKFLASEYRSRTI